MAGEIEVVGPVWPKRPGHKSGPRRKLHDNPFKKRTRPKSEKDKKPADTDKDDHSIDEYA